MKRNHVTGIALLAFGFWLGIVVTHLPLAIAAYAPIHDDLLHRKFLVSIDEVKKTDVSGDLFSGTYSTTVTMSDGTTRNIELTPMIHDGTQVVALDDSGHVTYLGLNDATTQDKLLIRVRDQKTMRRLLKAEGWNAHQRPQ